MFEKSSPLRTSLQIVSGSLMVGLIAFFVFGPGIVERGLNRVTPHEPWAVSAPARALHDSLFVADLHADPMLWDRDWIERGDRGHTDVPRALEGGMALQVTTAVTKSPAGQNYERNTADSDQLTALVFIQGWPMRTWSSPFERAVYQGRRLNDWVERSAGRLRLVRDRADLDALRTDREEGQRVLGAIFGIEGAHALDGKIENLDRLDELGLRVVGLTHFFDNRVGGSLHGTSGAGLTDLGRALVAEASKRHMIIDVAHASPASVREAIALSERPVFLSHTGFKGVCDSARNLEDALMLEIARSGGIVGVGFWDGAVCDASPKGVVRSIRYGIDLLGVDHVALGSDYDGATRVHFDASEIAVLTETMLAEGFSVEEIRKVMGENVYLFFSTWLP